MSMGRAENLEIEELQTGEEARPVPDDDQFLALWLGETLSLVRSDNWFI